MHKGGVFFFCQFFLHMSIETHACLSDDYETEIAQVEEAARAYREEKKAARRRRSGHEQKNL